MLCLKSAMVYFYLPCCWASRKPITSVEFKFVARQVEASVVIRAQQNQNLLEKVELESTLRNMLPKLATLYFGARQVGRKCGNTRNRGFQLAMQQCCETS